MPRMFSSSTYTAPAKAQTAASTLAQMQEREKLARLAAAKVQERTVVEPFGGAAKLLDIFNQNRAANRAAGEYEEGIGRQTEMLAGMGDEPTFEQAARIMELNPTLGEALLSMGAKGRADRAAASAAELIREDEQAQALKLKQMEIDARADKYIDHPTDPNLQINTRTNKTEPKTGNALPVGDDALRKKFDENEGKAWSDYATAAAVSAGTKQDMEVLKSLVDVVPSNPLTGALAQRYPGISSTGALFQSTIKRIAPTLRAPGSGSTSDIEYQGMLDSLPALTNMPGANRAIISMMEQKAQINMERGAIINQWRTGKITQEEARNQMAVLDGRSIMTPEIQDLIGAAKEGKEPPKPGPATPGIDQHSTEELQKMLETAPPAGAAAPPAAAPAPPAGPTPFTLGDINSSLAPPPPSWRERRQFGR